MDMIQFKMNGIAENERGDDNEYRYTENDDTE